MSNDQGSRILYIEDFFKNRETRNFLAKQEIFIGNHPEEIELESDIWLAIDEILCRENQTLDSLGTALAQTKPQGMNLASALRIFTVDYFRAAATEEGHARTSHGAFASR